MAYKLLLLEGCTIFNDSNDDEKCLLLARSSVIKKIIFIASVFPADSNALKHLQSQYLLNNNGLLRALQCKRFSSA